MFALRQESSSFKFEAIFALAGAVTLAAFFLVWGEAATQAGEATVHGFEKTTGKITFVGGWLMVIATMISYDAFNSPFLNDLKPLSDTVLGIIGAILGLAGGAGYVFSATEYSPTAGVYVVIAFGLVGLIVGILSLLMGGTDYSKGRSRSGRSGGL